MELGGTVASAKDAWPLWARVMSRYRHTDDIGVGDTVKRVANRLGGEGLKWLSAKLGIPCGCTERQTRWNATYPY